MSNVRRHQIQIALYLVAPHVPACTLREQRCPRSREHFKAWPLADALYVCIRRIRLRAVRDWIACLDQVRRVARQWEAATFFVAEKNGLRAVHKPVPDATWLHPMNRRKVLETPRFHHIKTRAKKLVCCPQPQMRALAGLRAHRQRFDVIETHGRVWQPAAVAATCPLTTSAPAGRNAPWRVSQDCHVTARQDDA